MQAFRNFAARLVGECNGSALLELAISLPLLTVFIVGIFDFSGAFNQKQKLESAAQAGAILAAAEPTSDIETDNTDPQSLHPVVTAVFNSLVAAGVVPLGTCTLSTFPAPTQSGLSWTYNITGCPDTLSVSVNRGWVPSTSDTTLTVGTQVTVTYPYHWRFNSVIQLLFPGANFNAPATISETAGVHNQM